MSEIIKIAPSILSADFAEMGAAVKKIDECGADVVHCDVMDGVFVKNITFGPKMIKDLRKRTSLTLDAHLMIVEPWKYVPVFAENGADYITVHYEACGDKLKDTLKQIKSFGVKCGAVINPDNDIDKIASVIEECDMVLLMSVFPGFGGQKFIESVLPKIEKTRKLIEKTGKDIDLEIDGGITFENVGKVKSAGANVIVAGNTLFGAPDMKTAINNLRNL